MKRLHFVKPNNLSALHDQILAAIPALRPIPNKVGRIDPFHPFNIPPIFALEPVMMVEGKGDDVWLTVPDTADEAAIAAVVQAHNSLAPRPPTAAEVAQAQATSAAADNLVAQMDKPFLARGRTLSVTEKAAIKDAVVNLITKAQGRDP